ncbi:G-type lectin S-receptor-like serine/threonine-protein kinase [Canna indica]|uniref:G-type lectin S-receptor-like serine/threonine-protein kinase n=1 Tax=Canna indica TaxID=4628 RepID=A0AAQ3KBD5_9LILI|nr:G-type lectin S-receptor-like serine/threonine-protein kinase [Canna indica]
MTWSGSKIYWRSQVWTGKFTSTGGSGAQGPNSLRAVYLTSLYNEEGLYMTLTLSDPSWYFRCTLNHSGEFQVWIWKYNWESYSSRPNVSSCNRYGWCGKNAFCDGTISVPGCKCLEGFEPKAENEWNTGNCTAGCTRKKALQCSDGDNFLRVESMKLPDRFVLLRNTNVGDCSSKCMANCSCVAYAYVELIIANSTTPLCSVWMGDLIDTEKLRRRGPLFAT